MSEFQLHDYAFVYVIWEEIFNNRDLYPPHLDNQTTGAEILCGCCKTKLNATPEQVVEKFMWFSKYLGKCMDDFCDNLPDVPSSVSKYVTFVPEENISWYIKGIPVSDICNEYIKSK